MAGDREKKEQERTGRRRRMKFGSYSMALTAVVIAGAAVLNLVAAELPSRYTQIDLSAQKLTVLSDQTKELADQLTEDITLYYIVQDGSRDNNISRLLERYDDLSEHITVEEKDPVLYPQFTSQYTDQTVSDNSVIAVSGDVSRVISYGEMYESEFNYNYYTYETTGFDGEGQITSAIAALCQEDRPVLYTLTGHNEITIGDTLLHSIEKENIQVESLNLVTSDQVPEDADCVLIASPSSDLSEAEAKKLLNYLRTGGKAVIITDYTGTEMEHLASVLEYYGTRLEEGVVMEGDSSHYVQMPYYLVPDISGTEVSEEMTGGNGYVLLAAAQGIRTLEESREGLQVTSVLSTSSSAYSKKNVQNMTTYEKEGGDADGPFDLGVLITETVELTDELLAETSAREESEMPEGLDAVIQETEAETESDESGKETEAGIEQDGSGKVTEAETESEESDNSDTEAENTDNDAGGSAKKAETAQTRLAVFTSSALIDDSADQMVSGGNSRLFMNTLSWICGQSASVSVPVKSLSTEYLTVTSSAGSFWSIVTIGLIPGVFLIGGLFVWLRRRRR